MIYLIGGAPRVGKSILGKKFADQLQTSLVSTDDLCDSVANQLSDQEKRTRFPFSNFSGDPQENTTLPEQRVREQYISANSLESTLDHLIGHALTEN